MFSLLSTGINILIAEDTYSRIRTLIGMISNTHGNIVYIDLDTVFTAYVRSSLIDLNSINTKLDIYFVSKGRLESMLAYVCSLDSPRLVVFDSIHGFYHLYDHYGNRVMMRRLNQLLTFYISLLLDMSSRHECPLLITSIRRRGLRIKINADRYLLNRSSVILYASSNDGVLNVDIIKHPREEMNGASISIDNN